MIFRNEKGEIIKAYPYGSEEKQRFEQGIKILARLYRLYSEQQADKKIQQEQRIDSQIEKCDKEQFKRSSKRSNKTYNMIQAARILGVHRGTLYYWIKKGWFKPKRDYKKYPVFTVLDIENLIAWKNSIKC